MNREKITEKICIVTDKLKEQGFLSYHTQKILHFRDKGVHIVPDDEFMHTVRLWIDCIAGVIICVQYDDTYLKKLSSEPELDWLVEFLEVKTHLNAHNQTNSSTY